MYQKRPTTTKLSNEIYHKWQRYPLVLCALDTGGGKTYIAIRSVRLLSKTASLFVITTKRQLDEQHWQNAVTDFNHVTNSQLHADYINYDILPTQTATIVKRFKQLPSPRVLIFDESHNIKNTAGSRFRVIQQALTKYADHMLALSATPYGNHVTDLAPYFILNGVISSVTAMKRYGVEDKYHQLIEYKQNGHIDWERTFPYDYQPHRNFGVAAHRFIHNISVAASTAKLMPPTKFFKIATPLGADGKLWYQKVKTNYRNHVYPHPMTTRIAYNHVLGSYHATKDYGLLTILRKQTTPTIVWYQYVATRDHLLMILRNYHVIIIDGHHHPDLTTIHNITDPKTVLLIQYQAGSAAIELPNAHTSIMYELTMSAIQFHQAQGRNRRALQTNLIRQYLFITPGTIEDSTYQRCIARNLSVSSALNKEIITATIGQTTNIPTYQPYPHQLVPHTFTELGLPNVPTPDITPPTTNQNNYNDDWQQALQHRW